MKIAYAKVSTRRFFRIKFPNDWSDEEKYQFDWTELKEEKQPFQKFNYDQIPT